MDSLTINWVGKTTVSTLSSPGARIRLRTTLAAVAPSSEAGCRTMVSAGENNLLQAKSSNPISDISLGHTMPLSRMAVSTPRVISRPHATTAVGRLARRNISDPCQYPESSL